MDVLVRLAAWVGAIAGCAAIVTAPYAWLGAGTLDAVTAAALAGAGLGAVVLSGLALFAAEMLDELRAIRQRVDQAAQQARQPRTNASVAPGAVHHGTAVERMPTLKPRD